MKKIWKRTLAMLLVVVMVCGFAPIRSLAEMDWSTLPDGAVSSWVNDGIGAVKSAASWLGERLHGLSLRASATTYSGTCGNNVTWNLNTDTGVLTISGTGAMNNYSYSSSAPWYSYRSSVKTVTIGSRVTSIGDYAFYYCTGLTSVTIPDSVTSIGYDAFYGCTGLTSVTIPDSVTSIGRSAFSGCTGLTSVTIGSGVTNIGDSAFSGCTNLATVNLGESVQTIDSNAFSSCTGLTSVTIPDSVTSIGNYAFSGCTGLTSVTIPDSVTSIGYDAFYGCTGLTSVAIPDSVTSIGRSAFSGCTSVTTYTVSENNANYSSDANGVLYNKVKTSLFYYPAGNTRSAFTIPDSVTSIGDSAFYYCTGLTSVTIPDGVTSIGGFAFSHCTGLTSVTIPDSVTSIGYDAFYGCTGLTSVTIPDSVTSIDYDAFSGCTGLTSVTIPDSVTSIGSSAFQNCSSLESISLPFIGLSPDAAGAGSVFGVIFGSTTSSSYSGTTRQYCSSSSSAYYYIPSSLRSVTITGEKISAYAFDNCAMLTDITIGSEVTSIGNYAFRGCTGLESVQFNAVNCTIMGSSSYPVFSGCTTLQTFIVGDNVKMVPSDALYGCTGVSEITIPDSVTGIGSSAFSGCTGLTRVNYTGTLAQWCGITFTNASANPVSVTKGLYLDDTLLTNAIIPDDVDVIGAYAFYNCHSLESVTIGSGVTRIGDYAFNGCTGLTSVTIGSGVTSIGSSAFQNCSSLESISLPFIGLSPDAAGAGSVFGAIFGYTTSSYSGTTRQYYGSSSSAYYYIPSSLRSVTVTGEKISAYAFDNCAMLTDITIGSDVTSIGNYAFRGCTGLESVQFNAVNCTIMGSSSYPVFSGCTALQTFTVGDNVKMVSSYALYGCSGVSEITIPESVTGIGSSAFSGCTGLTRINYTGTIAQWCGITFANASANPVSVTKGLYLDDTLLTNAIIPNSVDTISAFAFYNCQFLESVTICSGVTNIGASAFSGCTNLATVNLGESVQTIGSNAFYNCSSLTAITVPDSVTSIGSSSFSGCTNLATVNLGESVQTIGNSAFYNCTSLTVITVPDSVVSIGNYAFQFCTNLTSTTLGTGIQTIGTNAFDGCTALESFALNAEACGTMGTSSKPVFTNCPALKFVTIGDAATMIPNYAFYNCTSLERVTVGENVKTIGTQAFYNCSALRRVQFRGGKVSIAYDAFDYCGEYALCCSESSYWQAYAVSNGLRYVLTDETSTSEYEIKNHVLLGFSGEEPRITIPSAVAMVGFEAFCDNDTLTRVALPQSVTTVSDYAFSDCRNLAEVFIPDTVTSIGANAFSGSHPTIICIENSYAHRYAVAHNITVKFVRILIDLENAVMRVEIPYADEPEVSLVHLTGVSLQVIGLGSMPAKTSYRVGETLDTSGLSLEAHYTNGMTSVLRDGFSVSQPIFSEPGEQTVTLDYCGQTVEFTVTVTNEVVSGDADQSGTLDLKDIALLTRSLAGGWDVDLTDVDVDVNKDGEVNLKDAVLLRRYLAGGWGVQLA